MTISDTDFSLLTASDPWPAGGGRLSFSHSGEDRFLALLFADQSSGFYVDFGCFHPMVNSNTYLLYKKGWRGLNLDANARSVEAFARARPSDINCNYAIAERAGQVELFVFNDFAPSNTTSRQFANDISSSQSVPIKRTELIQALPTSEVIAKHLPKAQSVDFWNIDLESFDLVALQTNDWSRFRPRVIAVEDFDFIIDGPASPIHFLLRECGYRGIARYHYTTFYVDPRASRGLKQLPKIG